jgi:hypothetical protein
MLFHVTWEYTTTDEEAQRRSLKVFQSWQPPAGAEFQGFYGFADGTGGVGIVEVDSAATLARAIFPFTPWMKFTARALLPIEESAGVSTEAIAFRDSIS